MATVLRSSSTINWSFIIGTVTMLRSSKSLARGFARGVSLRAFELHRCVSAKVSPAFETGVQKDECSVHNTGEDATIHPALREPIGDHVSGVCPPAD